MIRKARVTIVSFFVAVIVLIMGRVFDSKPVFWASIALFVLWLVLWILEDVFDRKI